MTLTLKKDESGNFVPLTTEEINNALASCSEIKGKRNNQKFDQSVLLTALEGVSLSQNVTLDDLGL